MRLPRPALLLALFALVSRAGGEGTWNPGSRDPSANWLSRIWQTNEGLPHNAVNSLLQDEKGYLLLGTPGGLARFDGRQYVVSVPANTPGLPDERILALHQGRSGKLWVGTWNGLACREGNRWRSLLPADGLPDSPIRALCEDPDGSLWLGHESGLSRVVNYAVLRYHTTDDGLPDADVRDLQLDREGKILVLTRKGLARPAGRRFEVDQRLLNLTGEDVEFWDLSIGPDGDLYVCGAGFVARCRNGEWEKLFPHTRLGVITRMLWARDGSLWLAERGRGVLRLQNGTTERIDTSNGLSHDDIRALIEDREGNLWLGSNGGGVQRLKPRVVFVMDGQPGPGRATVSSVVSDSRGGLYAGTDGGGVFHWNGTSFSHLPLAQDGEESFYVWSLATTAEGALWIGGFREGLARHHDGKTSRWTMDDGLASHWIPALASSPDGTLWIGNRNGAVQHFDGRKFTTIRAARGDFAPAISALQLMRDGSLWVGTAGEGLLHWQDGEWRIFLTAAGLPSSTITALHEDDEGQLWVGTGLGLCLYAKGKFFAWSPPPARLDGPILQIHGDQQGNLWIGTRDGLRRIARRELAEEILHHRPGRTSIDYHGQAEGLLSPQFNSGHSPLSARDHDGQLWFSSTSGLVRVEPSRLPAAASPPPPILESMVIDARPVELPAPGQPVVLPAGNQSLTFQYTAIHFAAPERLRFRYRLDGLDTDWQMVENGSSAHYPFVPPGQYHFRLSASTDGTRWSHGDRLVAIEIPSRFWQRWWFPAICGAVLAALLATALRTAGLRRISRKVAALEQERRLQQERARIAQDLHDDLGASLTEIHFLGTLAGSSLEDRDSLRHRLDGIIQRARGMAKSLDEIVWTVNPANDSLPSTAHYLCSRAQESLRAAGIRCRLEVDEILPNLPVDSETRHHLLMAVNEITTNVLKHAAATEVTLHIHHQGSHLLVTFQDNGCGFDPATIPPSRHGLSNLRNRADATGGSLDIHTTPGLGTTIRLRIPLTDSPAHHHDSHRHRRG